MADTVFLRRLSRWQAEQQRESFADVYAAAYRGVPGEAFHDRQEFLQRFAADVQRTAFDMVIASGAGVVAGCAYGFRADHESASVPASGTHPHDADRAAIEQLTASGKVFAVAEVMVLPAYRRQGVAASMLEQLFVRTDATVATTRIARANTAARAAYRAWGWEERGAWLPAPAGDAPLRDVWSRRLRG